MNSQGSPRQQLIEAIPHLSDRQVLMVLQLIQTLQTKPTPDLSTSSDDPLSGFIGR